MARPSRADLRIVTGSTTLDLKLKPDSLVFGTAEPLNPIVNQSGELDFRAMNPKQGITWDITDFSKGLGGILWEQGYYYYALRTDTRWPGMVFPGPKGVADLTGIAGSERVMKHIKVGQDNWIITTTTVYRSTSGTGVWTEVGANGAGWTVGNPTDIIAFGASGSNPIIAVFMGSSTAFQTTIDNGTNWVASTKTANGGNANKGNYACVASRGGTAPKVWYVRNQNELYSTFDLTNNDPTGTTASQVGDNLNDDFTSIIEDKNGVLLIGTIQGLYSIDSNGTTYRLTPFYQHKTTSEGGTISGFNRPYANRNFENPIEIEGRIYYIIEEFRVGEWNADSNMWTDGIQPSSWAAAPALDEPIACMAAVGTELWVSLYAGTARSAVLFPGRSGLYGNIQPDDHETFAGKRQPDGTWQWHGSIFNMDEGTGESRPRYMWYDTKTYYLYFANAANQGANSSQTRAFVPLSHPLRVTNGGVVELNESVGGILIETGKYSQSQPNVTKTLRYATMRCRANTTPQMSIYYRVAEDDTTTAYTLLATYSTTAAALTGTAFPASTTFNDCRVAIIGNAGADNDYGILYSAQVVHQFYPTRYDDITFTVTAARGQGNRSGAMQGLTMSEVKTALEAWRDATTPATVTDNWTGDTWAMNLDRIEMHGTGKERTFVCTGHEVR